MQVPTVLHITFDYPSPLAVPHMTRAVERLVDSANFARNVVYAMTRTSTFGSNIAALRFAPDRVAVAYEALPKGIGLFRAMERLARWIACDLRDYDIRIDAIHAHKLTTDGIVASLLARTFSVPYICSIWGDADTYVFGGRPDLRRLWRDVAAGAGRLIAVAPWTAEKFASLLDLPIEAFDVLPVMSSVGSPIPSNSMSRSIASIFHLEHWRRKGLSTLVDAMNSLPNEAQEWELDIVGGGSASTVLKLSELVAKSKSRKRIRLLGPSNTAAVQALLGGAGMLALPSRSETFGMVFIEALFAGIPVLYPAGWSIDGFFPPNRIGYACQAYDAADVARGLHHVMSNQGKLKESIAKLQTDGEMDRFRPNAIARSYKDILYSVVK